MKKFSVLLAILCLLIGCKPATNEKVEKSSGNKKAKAIPDGVRENYKNDVLVSTVTYKEGLKNGPAKNYYPDGKVHSEFNYEDNIKHGEFKWFYEDGTLYQHAFFVHGKKDSTETTYFRNGKVRSIAQWKEGMPGTGLIEYTNTAKKRKFPGISIREINEVKLNDQYTLVIQLDDKRKKVQFYQETLIDDQFLPEYYRQIRPNKKGTVKLNFQVVPGMFLMSEINIIAKMKTPYKNWYIVQRKFNIAIDNREL